MAGFRLAVDRCPLQGRGVLFPEIVEQPVQHGDDQCRGQRHDHKGQTEAPILQRVQCHIAEHIDGAWIICKAEQIVGLLTADPAAGIAVSYRLGAHGIAA